MASPIGAKQGLKEEWQLAAQEPCGSYGPCGVEMEQLQAELQEHEDQRGELGRADATERRQSQAAAAEVCKARDSLDEAEADKQRKEAREEAAEDALQAHDDVRHDFLRLTGDALQETLMRASAAKEDKAGAVELALDEALQPSASSSRSLTRVLFPSWTTGSIYSNSAKYRHPATGQLRGGWVPGYPHREIRTVNQRFVLHFDSGNLSRTCISKTTFDFLGLASSAKKCGIEEITGLHGASKQCPLYEIRFTVDIVNNMHPDRGHIFARTVTAAVLEIDSKPGEVGHLDLLVNAEDTCKFTNLEVHGEKFRFDVLQTVPALYVEQPLIDGLITHERFGDRLAAPPQPTTVQVVL
ncbi:unnamed protein product [Polarella glacialis]|uniref:Uncharacterized protein n=1 Tax=Polarella glacialis TaxID=89957 RepID=A0A813FEU6_POLGL|nr:unnamed protein product [Polarella glacialis]